MRCVAEGAGRLLLSSNGASPSIHSGWFFSTKTNPCSKSSSAASSAFSCSATRARAACVSACTAASGSNDRSSMNTRDTCESSADASRQKSGRSKALIKRCRGGGGEPATAERNESDVEGAPAAVAASDVAASTLLLPDPSSSVNSSGIDDEEEDEEDPLGDKERAIFARRVSTRLSLSSHAAATVISGAAAAAAGGMTMGPSLEPLLSSNRRACGGPTERASRANVSCSGCCSTRRGRFVPACARSLTLPLLYTTAASPRSRAAAIPALDGMEVAAAVHVAAVTAAVEAGIDAASSYPPMMYATMRASALTSAVSTVCIRVRAKDGGHCAAPDRLTIREFRWDESPVEYTYVGR